MRGSPLDTHPGALDETEAALASGVTALTPSSALRLIDHWRTACLDARDLDLSEVASGLSALRGLLSADALDGRTISDTLVGLAESTRTAARQTPDASSLTPRLERIAATLDRVAITLGA